MNLNIIHSLQFTIQVGRGQQYSSIDKQRIS
jgi:hypothetical protein